MAGILKRSNYTALVDDDGTGTVGTIWNKSQVLNLYDDPAEGIQFSASSQTFAVGAIRLNSNVLGIAGGTSGVIIYDDDAATARVTVDGSGNVGVGMTPSFLFDVNGHLRAAIGSVSLGQNALQAAVRTLHEVYEDAVAFAVLAMEA